MNAREVAWRVFAEEYNSSVLEHKGEGEKPVSYIVTPLGARVNRMLVVGVVTDGDDVQRFPRRAGIRSAHRRSPPSRAGRAHIS